MAWAKKQVHSKPREIWRHTIKGRRAIRSKPLILALSILLIWSFTLAVRIHNKAGEDRNRLEAELQELENQNQKQKENLEKQIEDEKKRADARVSERLAREKQTPKKVSVYDTGACITAMKNVFPESLWTGAEKVLSHENGSLNPNAIGGPNKNGTYDYGCFQINGEKEALDPVVSATRAYDKYKGGRVGANNWSAWYAVCTPGNNPQPKYAGVRCNG